MTIQQAKDIPIDALLYKLGFQPHKTINGAKWYCAPTREEKTPSFKLSTDARAWFDHGTGEGGNILDLAFRLQTNLSPTQTLDSTQIKQALAFIQNLFGDQPLQPITVRSQPAASSNSPAYSICSCHPFQVYTPDGALTQAASYLRKRGIDPPTVAPYLQEVTYVGTDGRQRAGFGLPNLAGGYELRRLGDWVKMALGPKHITVFQAHRQTAPWHTFYSLIDFCTFLTVDQPPVGAYQYLIINSDSLVQKAIDYLTPVSPGFMFHYPHQDQSGQKAHEKLLAFLEANQWSGGARVGPYQGYKDWTEARERKLGLI
jgi:hypothetical protein